MKKCYVCEEIKPNAVMMKCHRRIDRKTVEDFICKECYMKANKESEDKEWESQCVNVRQEIIQTVQKSI